MDWVLLAKALIMGMVEGLTEFLPISSTGHLIVTGDLLNFLPIEQRGVFEISIQLGAIMAVCWEYRHRLLQVGSGLHRDPQARRLAGNVVLAFVPSGVLALWLGKAIKAHLFSPAPVAAAFVLGGLVMLWAEGRKHTVRVHTIEDMTWRDALKVGFAQCFALIPGASRSGATIIGAMLFGMSRETATVFSFFLAIPTLTSAALYDLYQHGALLDGNMAGLLAAGFAMSFLCALVAVRGLLRYISHHDFSVFAWYRIAFGLVVLITAYLDVVHWSR